MKLLMLSIDIDLFEEGSAAIERMKDYASLVEELHIVVYAPKELREKKIGENIFLYPTKTHWEIFYFRDAWRVSRRIIQEHGLTPQNTLVTSQDAFTHIVAVWLKRKFGFKIELQVHTDFLSPYFKKESFTNYLRYRAYVRTLPKADSVRVVSERLRRSVTAMLGIPEEKITVLPIFTDLKAFYETKPSFDLRRKYPDYDFIILMASRLTIEKNIESALSAMRDVIGRFPRTLLLIVGEGPERLRMEFEIIKWGLSDNVKLEGWTKDLVSYYKTANLFLVTSWYEGYGRTVVEAMASNIPILMTDVGVAGDLIVSGEHGVVVPPGNTKLLSDELMKLIVDVQRRRFFVVKAREHLQKAVFQSKEEYLSAFQKSLQKVMA